VKIGAQYKGNRRCEFTVWAPLKKEVQVEILSNPGRITALHPDEEGYWRAECEGVSHGDHYLFKLGEGKSLPDPASHFQPQGVHGPSQVIDHHLFTWSDEAWRGIPLSEMIMYELHVGTFTPEGTLDAIIPRLGDLQNLGINTIELMPIAQFPGDRNWGYDGVYLFSVQNSYGGPDGLKKLVDACHQRGLALILDVVYNHLGPEGNYIGQLGPYFTEKYQTPWGAALNFDDAYSDGVHNFFIENVLHWFREYHLDALRLDAIHAIMDRGANPFLMKLAEKTDELARRTGRRHALIAESDLNDAKIIKPRDLGGYGIHAQWCDDFHHALHTLLTHEKQGYYMDFGTSGQLRTAYRNGFIYTGQFSSYRKRSHGNSSKDRPADQFVVYSQNHDQIGNRPNGKRLSERVSFENLKLAAGVVLLSPYIPMLFMGEEYAENSPFLYFVSHSEPGLISAVRKKRKEEFQALGWNEDPPDPQGKETFLKSKIHWDKREKGQHKMMLEFYQALLDSRKQVPALRNLNKDQMEVWGNDAQQILYVHRWSNQSQVLMVFNFSQWDRALELPPAPEGEWEKKLDSADHQWSGPGGLLPKTIRGQSVAIFLLKI